MSIMSVGLPAVVHAQDTQSLYKAREHYMACQALLNKGRACEALRECERGLDAQAIDVLEALTKDAREACADSRVRKKPPAPTPVMRPPDPPSEVTPVDADGDGIVGDADRCPGLPEDGVGQAPRDGCPNPDADSDGVKDAVDQCPQQAEDLDGVDDADGCPDLDNDQDGVADVDDRCPNQAEDPDGFADTDGCPELDNDQDGVADPFDRCPEQAEDIDGVDDTDGCPESNATRPWVWTTIGVGGGLTVAGGIMQAVAMGEKKAVTEPETEDGFVQGMTQQQAQDQLSRANTLEAVALTSLGVGAAVLATGVVIWLTDDDDDAGPSLSVAPSLRGLGVGLQGQF